jgi:hypothetical protein
MTGHPGSLHAPGLMSGLDGHIPKMTHSIVSGRTMHNYHTFEDAEFQDRQNTPYHFESGRVMRAVKNSQWFDTIGSCLGVRHQHERA